jgi:hypothetical protein
MGRLKVGNWWVIAVLLKAIHKLGREPRHVINSDQRSGFLAEL